MPDPTIYSRCRDGGPWRRLLPGIIMLVNGVPTRRQRILAALSYGGPRALLTGLEACRDHGVRRGPDANGAVHILVPHDHQLRAAEYVTVERTRRLPDAIKVRGIRLSPPARACIDATRIRSAREVAEILADAVQRRICTVAELQAELASCGRRGSATPRSVLAEVGDGVRSAAERDALRLWRRAGLPPAQWNVPVYDRRGRLLGVVDGWCDDVALAWEIDSYAFHLSPADYARTTAKAARLIAAGVVLLSTLPTRLSRDPDGVVAELRAVYQVAATRPRPPVRTSISRGGPCLSSS